MKRSILLPFLAFGFLSLHAQTVCNPTGNVVIYSNYDGGALNIVVDENIPDLHIGVVGYEFARIDISGPYASNVTAVWYAGYNGADDHCALGGDLTTTVTGVDQGLVSVQFAPQNSWTNPNGYSMIICNYSCNVNTNQGGCNTADQIAHYFLSNWGGVLRYQLTQYGCWQGSYAISAGGNCCEDPLSTDVSANKEQRMQPAFPNPATNAVNIGIVGAVEVMDASGRKVVLATDARGILELASLVPGIYTYRKVGAGITGRFEVQR